MKKLVAQKKHAFLYLIILAAFTMDFLPCNAQYGKIEKEQTPVINEHSIENETPTVNFPANEQEENKVNEEKKSEVPALVYDLPFAPGIVHQFLLDNIEFKSTGIFRLNRVSVAYVPERDETGEKADYIRFLRLHTKLKKDGAEIFDKYYQLYQKNKVAARFMFARNPKKENVANSDNSLEAGNYELEFYFDNKLFAKFPFEIMALKDEDPNATGKQKTFIKGMWDDYGYLNWKQNATKGKQPTLKWSIYYQIADLNTDKEYSEVYCEMYKNNEYFATTGKKSNKIVLEGNWKRTDYSFYLTGREERADPRLILTKGQLEDAKYEVRDYGYGSEKINIFKFEVIDGEIVPDKQEGSALTIEGLEKVFWLKKQ